MPLICFASPKGGVGKTTLAANVAAEIARAGRRVVALDLDPQNALRLHFGIPLADLAGYTRLLAQRQDWRGHARRTEVGVALLPFGQVGMTEALHLGAAVAATPALLTAALHDMRGDPDTAVIVDTAPGPSALLSATLPATDLLVTVLLADATSVSLIPQVEGGVSFGPGLPAPGNARIGYVLNQLDPRTRLGPAIGDAATRHLGTRLLGTIYRDENVAEAMAAQKHVADYAPAAKAAADIAALARAIAARVFPGRAGATRTMEPAGGRLAS